MLYVIGDIHGMRAKLVELLEMLPLDSGDHLLFIGDYIDRGPESKETVDLLLRVRERYRCTFLLGNHESMMLDFRQLPPKSISTPPSLIQGVR